jgi:hypothetical protein
LRKINSLLIKIFINYIYKYFLSLFGDWDWGLGIGDLGIGIGDWGLGIGPNPQSPIPNPHFKIDKMK